MVKRKILAISGSTRINSSNEAILRFIGESHHDQIDLEFYDQLKDLPHFNPDLDNEFAPAIVVDLRQKIERADGVIICTPEYVFSVPGSLKNALEWTVSTTVFSDKPFALIVASGMGEKTFESMTLIMNTLGVKMTEQSRLLIQGARSKINQGQVADPMTKKEIKELMVAFLNLVLSR